MRGHRLSRSSASTSAAQPTARTGLVASTPVVPLLGRVRRGGDDAELLSRETPEQRDSFGDRTLGSIVLAANAPMLDDNVPRLWISNRVWRVNMNEVGGAG